MNRLCTVGHGTLAAEEFAALVGSAGIEAVVDVRTAPGSRRHPHFARAEMERWLPAAGVGYRWERALGGFRRPVPGSPNTALRHAGFRGYADYMATEAFSAALQGLLADVAVRPTAVMCAETLWWRCHRRLVADAAVLLHGVEVVHLGHDGRLGPHRPTEGARVEDGRLRYDGGQPGLPGAAGAPASGQGATRGTARRDGR
jgi:uncharacterized protein (DUF488 family)